MKVSALQENINASVNKTADKKVSAEQEARLMKSAKELEGLFLSHVLKVMRKTIPKESGQSSNMVDMMFSGVMGKGLAEQGGIGMSKFLYDALAENDIQAIEKLKTGSNVEHSLKYNINTMESRDE